MNLNIVSAEPNTILGLIGVLLAALGVLVALALGVPRLVIAIQQKFARQRWDKLQAKLLATGQLPFRAFGVEELPSALGISEPDIPYIERLTERTRKQVMDDWRLKRRILVIGRAGAGRSREAAELVKRLETERGEPVLVLLPLFMARPVGEEYLSLLHTKKTKTVVLLVDDIHEMYAGSPPGEEPLSFHQRFREVTEYFSRLPGWHFRIIATLDEAFVDQVEPTDALQEFAEFRLWPLAWDLRVRLVDILAERYRVSVEQAAHRVLVDDTDGTFPAIIAPLSRESRKRKARIGEADIQDYPRTYPTAWKLEVYDKYISSSAPRRAILAAIGLLRQAKVSPRQYLVVEVASKLWPSRKPFKKRQLRKDLEVMGRLGLFIDPWNVVHVPSPYLVETPQLTEHATLLIDLFLAESRRRKRYPELVLDLLSLATTLLHRLDQADKAAILFRCVLEFEPESLSALLGLADALAYLGEEDEAEKIAIRARALDRDNPRVWRMLAKVRERAGDLEGAIRGLKTALRLNPLDACTWQILGITYHRRRKYLPAMYCCRKATTLADSWDSPWRTLAYLQGDVRQVEQGLVSANRALEISAHDAHNHHVLGILLDKAGRREDAIAAISHCIELSPNDASPRCTLGFMYLDMGQYKQALAEFSTGLDIAPDSFMVWVGLSKAQRLTGDLGGWAESCAQIASQFSSKRFALLWAGRALTMVRRYQEAIEPLEELVRRNPTDLSAAHSLGFAYSYLEEYEKAIPYLEQVTRKRPKDWMAKRALGFAYSLTGCWREAADIFEELLSVRPGWRIVERVLGFVYTHLGEREKAIKFLEPVVARDPSDLDAKRQLAFSYSFIYRHERAIPLLEELRRSRPQDIDITRQLAFCYLYEQMDDDAVPLLRRLIVQFPNDPAIERALGISLTYVGEMHEAIPILERVVLRAPGDRTAKSRLAIARQALEAGLEKDELAAARRSVRRAGRRGIPMVEQGNVQEGLELLESTARRYSNDPEAWNNYGVGLRKAGRIPDAICACTKAVELVRSFSVGWYSLGRAYEEAGNPDEAVDSFLQAVEFRTGYKKAWKGLSRTLGALQSEKRQEVLQAAVTKYAELPDVATRLSELLEGYETGPIASDIESLPATGQDGREGDH